MFGWYSIVPNNFWGWKKKQKPFLHLSLSKASPFTLESHICVKALKCRVFQIIRCLMKPFLKNSFQTFFHGCTSWVAQLLNNMNVWMVLYCAQQLLGLKKQKLFLHLSLSRASPFTLGNHICVKALKCKVFQTIRCLIKPFLKTAPRQFFEWVPHEWLSYSVIWMFGWYPSLITFGVKKQKLFLHLSLSRAIPFTLESHICVKALKFKVFQIIRCLINPFLKNSFQTIFQGGTSWVAQLLNNMDFWMVLYCAQQLVGLKKIKNLLHLSLSKAGPFTLGNHICVKTLICKVFQTIRCLIKPLFKTSIQTIFQGGTSWVAQLLNNINVWMAPYCAQQLLGLKKQKLFLHLSLSRARPFTLESHICVKALKFKVFQIIRCLIKPFLKKHLPNIFSWVYLMSDSVTQ